MTMVEMGQDVNGQLVELDLDVLIETRMLVQATSGGGKSYLLRRLMERTAGQVQQLIIDVEGEFVSLRERDEYVICAPSGGDVVAHPRSAAMLAKRLLETGVSAIMNIYDLKRPEREDFVAAFFDALVNAPKALWHPALVVLDEAHAFAPERGKPSSADPVIDLATRGRKRGFCLVLATQRLAKLHKDTSAEMLNKAIGRTSQDVDVRRATDELGMASHKEALPMLRAREPGEFFFYGPAMSLLGIELVSVGECATTHPKVGRRSGRINDYTPPPATARIKTLLSHGLSDIPRQAEEERVRVRQLETECAKLRKLLQQAQQSAGISETEVARRIADASSKFYDEAFGKGVASTKAAVLAALDNGIVEYAVEQVVMPSPAAKAAAAPATPCRPGLASIPRPQQRILDAIAWMESLGIPEPSQVAVAYLAGYKYGGGAYNNPRARLKVSGLVEYRGNNISMTPAGRELAQLPTETLTTNELHERVLDRLTGPEKRLLRPLLDAYPDALTNEELASEARYTVNTGGYNNPRGRLKSLQLVEYPRPGQVRAGDVLFPQPEGV